MVRWMALGLVVCVLAASGAQAQQLPARTFGSDAGIVLNFIKVDKTADFEAVVGKLKEALQKSDKPQRKEQAASWKVFKGQEAAAGGNALYVFVIEPSVKGADYEVFTILNEAFPSESRALYDRFRESLASGQTILNLALTADFGK